MVQSWLLQAGVLHCAATALAKPGWVRTCSTRATRCGLLDAMNMSYPGAEHVVKKAQKPSLARKICGRPTH